MCVCIFMHTHIHKSVFTCVCIYTCGGILPPEQHFNSGICNDHRKLVQLVFEPPQGASWLLHHVSAEAQVLGRLFITPQRESCCHASLAGKIHYPLPRGTIPQGEPCGCQSQLDALLCIQPEQHSYLWCMG